MDLPELPTEILEMIFYFLPMSEAKNICSVNSIFHYLFYRSRRAVVLSAGNIVTDVHYYYGLSFDPQVEFKHLGPPAPADSDEFPLVNVDSIEKCIQFCNIMPFIEDFSYNNVGELKLSNEIEILHFLISKLSKLKKLRIYSYCNVPSIFQLMQHPLKLKSLILDYGRPMNNTHLNTIFEKVDKHSLHALSISRSLANNHTLKSISKSYPNLVKLGLRSCASISADGIQYICSLKNLKILYVDGNRNINDECIHCITENLVLLEKFRISYSNITSRSMQNLRKLKYLQLLHCYGCYHLKKEDLKYIAFDSLRELDIGKIPAFSLTKPDLEALLERNTNLFMLLIHSSEGKQLTSDEIHEISEKYRVKIYHSLGPNLRNMSGQSLAQYQRRLYANALQPV